VGGYYTKKPKLNASRQGGGLTGTSESNRNGVGRSGGSQSNPTPLTKRSPTTTHDTTSMNASGNSTAATGAPGNGSFIPGSPHAAPSAEQAIVDENKRMAMRIRNMIKDGENPEYTYDGEGRLIMINRLPAPKNLSQG
jgi:hypothetical protein